MFSLNPYNTDLLIAEAYFHSKGPAALVRKNEPVFLEKSSFVVVSSREELFSEQIDDFKNVSIQLLDAIRYYDGRYSNYLATKYHDSVEMALTYSSDKNTPTAIELHYQKVAEASAWHYPDHGKLPSTYLEFIALIKSKLKHLKITRVDTGERYMSSVSHTPLPITFIYIDGRAGKSDSAIVSYEAPFIAKLYADAQKVPIVVTHDKGYSVHGVASDYDAERVRKCLQHYNVA